MNIFILFGQTATGKTAKALELVKKYDGEIVNFDSRQIYKKLDIVTGKDLPKNSLFVKRVAQNVSKSNSVGYYEFKNVTRFAVHTSRLWLYDLVDPKTIFSSVEYVQCAEEVINDILSRGKTPILVGGTGYYLRHLILGTPEIAVKEDWTLRKELETKTVDELQGILKETNNTFLESMNNSDRNNPRRLIRRIEIAKQGGALPEVTHKETLSARLANLRGLQRAITITYLPFFHYSRLMMVEKITLRVEQRLQNGAMDEVKKLLKEGYTKEDPGLNAIGYQQIIGYLENKLTLNEMKKQWITREVQYAKRQKTYFKKYFTT